MFDKTHIFRFLLLLVSGMAALHTTAQAQAAGCSAAVDSASVELGNAFALHLRAPASSAPGEPGLSTLFEAMPAENLLDSGAWMQMPGGVWKRSLQLIALDTGTLQLPPIRIPLPGGDTCETAPVTLRVTTPYAAADPAELADIKDIHRTPFSWKHYLPWMAAGFAALLLLAIILWVINRLYRQAPAKNLPLPLTPLQEASRRLQALEQRKPWLQGDVAGYYTELSHVLRTLVERQTGLPALEMPVTDWLGGLPESVQIPLSNFLDDCDLAKFARHTPPPESHPEALQRAWALVQQFTAIKQAGL